MGPSSSTVWRDSYISAISQRRAAGYHATLSFTSGGCGQDNDLEKNVVFDRHVYGGDGDAGVLDTDVQALAALGLPAILGEFGPGRSIGPSPTNLTPGQVIQTAETYGLGWMSWAWDDNNLSNAQADNDSFALSYTGAYTTSSDLTIAGQEVVEGCTNPAPGGCGCPDSPQPAFTAVAPGAPAWPRRFFDEGDAYLLVTGIRRGRGRVIPRIERAGLGGRRTERGGAAGPGQRPGSDDLHVEWGKHAIAVYCGASLAGTGAT